MGKRSRQRARAAGPQAGRPEPLLAPTSTYADAAHGQLVLRGTLTAKARAEYANTFGGGRHREDAWQRATELLFERLAVSWTIAEVAFEHQRELIGRYRMASPDERRFVREALRAHLAEHFPELEAP